MNFYYDEEITGKDYGIQVDIENLTTVLRIIKTVAENVGLHESSHHGQLFNLTRSHNMRFSVGVYKDAMRIVFQTKYWTTEFHKNGRPHNFESVISKEQKDCLKEIVECAGMKIIDSWNDEKEGPGVSVAVDIKNITAISRDLFISKLNEFDNLAS